MIRKGQESETYGSRSLYLVMLSLSHTLIQNLVMTSAEAMHGNMFISCKHVNLHALPSQPRSGNWPAGVRPMFGNEIRSLIQDL